LSSDLIERIHIIVPVHLKWHCALWIAIDCATRNNWWSLRSFQAIFPSICSNRKRDTRASFYSHATELLHASDYPIQFFNFQKTKIKNFPKEKRFTYWEKYWNLHRKGEPKLYL